MGESLVKPRSVIYIVMSTAREGSRCGGNDEDQQVEFVHGLDHGVPV